MGKIELLNEKINEWGASKCAFSNLEGILPERYRHLKYGISIAVRLSDAIVNEIEDKPTHTYFHHYRSLNALIDNITLRTSLLLQDWGYLALAVPASQTVKTEDDFYTGIFQHKTAARLSGLGWIGKNALLITPEYGPRVRLGTVFTNMELPVDNKQIIRDCGECTLCTDACPAAAIQGRNWRQGMQRSSLLDAEACSNHMRSKYKLIGRGSVCGICMKVCPIGSKINR